MDLARGSRILLYMYFVRNLFIKKTPQFECKKSLKTISKTVFIHEKLYKNLVLYVIFLLQFDNLNVKVFTGKHE